MKTCSKCRDEKPHSDFYKNGDGLSSYCKACVKIRNAEYRAKHKEKLNAYNKDYYRQNKNRLLDYAKEYNKAYYQENRDSILEKHKQWRNNNPGYESLRLRTDREGHLQEGRLRSKAHYESNKEAYLGKCARRRQLKSVDMDSVDHTLSTEYRKAITGDPCHYCGESCEVMHVDHYEALANGGTDHWWNLVRACADCNLSKGSKTVEEWLTPSLS
jgi:5-methylcytosine-specific restriction endonuclease McrA